MQSDSDSKKKPYSPPTATKVTLERNSSWQTMPIAAIRKQWIYWSRYAENSSRIQSSLLPHTASLPNCSHL
jgi:hypothetical protein